MSDHLPAHHSSPEKATPRRTSSLWLWGAATIMVVAAGWGILARRHAVERLVTARKAEVVANVDVVRPVDAGDAPLTLPGRIEAWDTAPIYPRVDGYIRRWLVDIGDHVHAGQVLAEIDTPELDQQIAQSRAEAVTANADANLARTTADRWTAILRKDAVSRQEVDEKVSDAVAKRASADAKSAAVRRLEATKGFALLRAPFDGAITTRAAQTGALVVAGTTATTPIFTVADDHRVRIHVRIPQTMVDRMGATTHAHLTLPEFPGRVFDATVARRAGAVDPGAGTTLIELQTDNPEHRMRPGGYAQVTFDVAAAPGTVRIPSTALVLGQDGTRVAVVDSDHHVRWRTVTIGRDLGAIVEVTHGLTGTDEVIDAPPDVLDDGDAVRIVDTIRSSGQKPSRS